MSTTTAPRQIAPVALRNSSTGSWLREWSNGEELLVRAESGRLVDNPARLAANIYRTEGTKSWTVRLFLPGNESVVHDDLWSLRQVRQMLAYIAADWAPEPCCSMYLLRQQAQRLMQAAWLESADAEIERI